MLKMSLLATLLVSLFALAACESAPAAADGSKTSADPGIRVSGYVESGGGSALR
jgi:hypothetical protein